MNLKVDQKKLKETKVKLTIELATKDFVPFQKRALEKLAQGLELKGFRKGKVPVKIARDHLPEDKIAQEALSLALPEIYLQAIQETKLRPIGSPKVNVSQFEKGKPVIIEVEIELLPKIELPDYAKLKIEKRSAKVTDKELEEGITGLRQRLADYQKKNGPAKTGDWVEITFEGFLGGAKVEQLSSKNHPFLLGQGGFVKGFEDQLVGLEKGQKKEFELKLPQTHPDKTLAGKKINFKVELNQLKKVKLSSLSQLAKKLGAKDEADLKKRFQQAKEKQKKEEAEKEFEQRLVAEVVDGAKLKLPDQLVGQEYQRILEDYKQGLAKQNISLKDYLEKQNISQKEFEKTLKKTAVQNVKVGLVMSEVGQQEKIVPAEKEVKTKTNQLISQGMMQGQSKSDLEDHYRSEEGQRFIQNVVRNEKTLKRLKELIEE
jgi:trigger factor